MKYGKGYDRSNLYHCLRFYKEFPQIVDTASAIPYTAVLVSLPCIIASADFTARNWYENEAYEQTWSVRTLQRNINTQYYYRLI